MGLFGKSAKEKERDWAHQLYGDQIKRIENMKNTQNGSKEQFGLHFAILHSYDKYDALWKKHINGYVRLTEEEVNSLR